MKIIRFRRPPLIGGQKVERLTLQAPTVADRLKAERMGPAGADEIFARLIALCAGLTVKRDDNPLSSLPRKDFEGLQMAIGAMSLYAGVIEDLPDGRKRVTLARPLTLYSGTVVTALDLREPLASDTFKVGRMGGTPGPYETELRTMALCCGVDPMELERGAMLLSDYTGLQEAYQGFSGGVEEEEAETAEAPPPTFDPIQQA